ncbi:MAG: nicotinate-nucleotide adenylyltransferase [Pirellulales bacterium]
MAERIGILGGSFDPVHYAHLLLAETARETLRLDAVWFIPAASPPHKVGRRLAAAEHRVEMLKLAIADHRQLSVQTLEIDRGGTSYTVHTLEECHQRVPGAEFFLIVGADMLHDLPNWYQPQRICELAVIACAHRPASPPPDLTRLASVVSERRLSEFAAATMAMPQIELSSTDLRQRVLEGRSIRYRTPRAVECYIAAQGLYR